MYARNNVDFSKHVTTFDDVYVRQCTETLLRVLTTFLPFLTQPLVKYICKNGTVLYAMEIIDSATTTQMRQRESVHISTAYKYIHSSTGNASMCE